MIKKKDLPLSVVYKPRPKVHFEQIVAKSMTKNKRKFRNFRPNRTAA